MAELGIGPSAHRLFSHRSYKVTVGMKNFMIFCQQMAGVVRILFQTLIKLRITGIFLKASILYWCRVHRTHHKFTDTDKDPTDINRGLFYSYTKWFWLTHTPEVQEEMDKIFMADLLKDEVLQFQHK